MKTKPDPGGRPPYQPTPKDHDQVATLAGMGIPDYDIAKVMQMSGPTLRKYFAEELDLGHIKANAAVARSLYKQATDPVKPSVAAAIFWLKCRAGWRDESAPEYAYVSKKVQANDDAVTAQAGTPWEALLPGSTTPQ